MGSKFRALVLALAMLATGCVPPQMRFVETTAPPKPISPGGEFGCQLDAASHRTECPCAVAVDLQYLNDQPDQQVLSLNVVDTVDLSVLERLSHVREIHIVTKRLSLLENGAAVTRLHSLSTNVSSDDLRLLGDLKQLVSLTLSPADVQGREPLDLGPLRSLTGLRELRLAKVQVRSLEPLSNLQELQFLEMVDKIDLAPLSGLGGLEEVSLTGAPVDSLRPLFSLPKLERIHLSKSYPDEGDIDGDDDDDGDGDGDGDGDERRLFAQIQKLERRGVSIIREDDEPTLCDIDSGNCLDLCPLRR